MYTDYVGNFDKATETLSLWTKKLPTMAALIDEIQVSYRTQDTYTLPMWSSIRLDQATRFLAATSGPYMSWIKDMFSLLVDLSSLVNVSFGCPLRRLHWCVHVSDILRFWSLRDSQNMALQFSSSTCSPIVLAPDLSLRHRPSSTSKHSGFSSSRCAGKRLA